MTPLFKKLNYKDHLDILCLNAPKSFDKEVVQMSTIANIHNDIKNNSEWSFVIVFAVTQSELDNYIEEVVPVLREDAVVWFCYPKKSSKNYKCEFNRDTGWQLLGHHGYEGVRMVAIDTDWSALRFRHISKIKKFTRRSSMAISDKGKARTKNK